MENLAETFASALKKARGERSQAEFARILGIEHQATYQRYEAGRIPDADVLYQMATRIGVRMEQLLTGEEITLQDASKIREEMESWKRKAQDAEHRLESLRSGLRTLLELTSPKPNEPVSSGPASGAGVALKRASASSRSDPLK